VTTTGFDDRLRLAGLRVTAPRLAVLSVLAESGDHPPVNLVTERVRARVGTISTQAVYDICEALARAGLARRIEPAGSPARYEARAGDNHHHLVCRTCGVTLDVDCAVGTRPCLEAADAQGFVIDEAEVTYWGICPACQATTKGSTDA
jgi:Fur family ferric uptake transcriptional regulator